MKRLSYARYRRAAAVQVGGVRRCEANSSTLQERRQTNGIQLGWFPLETSEYGERSTQTWGLGAISPTGLPAHLADHVSTVTYSYSSEPRDELREHAATTDANGDIRFSRYLDREIDPELALQYNRTRSFDPTIGVWITEEGVVPAGAPGAPLTAPKVNPSGDDESRCLSDQDEEVKRVKDA